MAIYWITIIILGIILPRYTLQHFNQPKEDIIEDTKRIKCGLKYYLERQSPSTKLFNKLSHTGDKIADDLWVDLLKLIAKTNMKSQTEIDPLDILLENVDTNPKFKALIDNASKIPNWCDFEKLNIAQKLHQRLSLPFAYVLGICTLVGGFGCPEINKVLISSRYWASNNDHKSLKNTLNRLRETTVWLYTVVRHVHELKPFGKAWKSILRVRLFHAKIRYQLSLKTNKQINENNDVNVEEMVPINQLHLIGTLLGFQFTPLVVLKTILGIPISNDESEAYTMLWRYIGYILGCVEWTYDQETQQEKCIPLESYSISRSWMAKVWDELINPDINEGLNSTTLMLSQHVLKSISLQKILGKFSLNIQTIEAFFRAFLTEEYADMVKLASIHWSYELQIRVIFALMRIVHIILYQLHLNWLGVIVFRRLFDGVIKHLTFDVLEKKEKYHCRFAKYCSFTKN